MKRGDALQCDCDIHRPKSDIQHTKHVTRTMSEHKSLNSTCKGNILCICDLMCI